MKCKQCHSQILQTDLRVTVQVVEVERLVSTPDAEERTTHTVDAGVFCKRTCLAEYLTAAQRELDANDPYRQYVQPVN